MHCVVRSTIVFDANWQNSWTLPGRCEWMMMLEMRKKKYCWWMRKRLSFASHLLTSLEETEALQIVVEFQELCIVGWFVENTYGIYFDHCRWEIFLSVWARWIFDDIVGMWIRVMSPAMDFTFFSFRFSCQLSLQSFIIVSSNVHTSQLQLILIYSH